MKHWKERYHTYTIRVHYTTIQFQSPYLEARLLLTRTMDTLQKLYMAQEVAALKELDETEDFSLAFTSVGVSTNFCISGSLPFSLRVDILTDSAVVELLL